MSSLISKVSPKTRWSPTGPRPDGASPQNTIPIIPDHFTGAVLSNSPAIAAYLDKSYPSSGPVLIPAGRRFFIPPSPTR
ncbi:hypothetical protein EDD85DRAFT_549046 [Armillaria nabsnona]|nr:hypothetical protein EDD85DRAFT_549046 [Armillaria nabsnona]